MIDKSVKKNKTEESIDDFSVCRDCKRSDDSFVDEGELVENPELVCEFTKEKEALIENNTAQIWVLSVY